MQPPDWVIHVETGEMRFAKPAGSVIPGMDRREFLKTMPDKKFTAAGTFRKYQKYDNEQAVLGNARFLATAVFQDERLVCLSLTHNDPEFTSGPWSANDNDRLHQFHNDWLTAILGKQRQFRWGTVESNFDNKSGFITIDLRFSS